MGQYYYVVNLDKREYLHPWKFGDGLKLMEFAMSRNGTLTALAVLLASSNGRGGGDLNSSDPLIGSWAGDRIAVVGDYEEAGDPVTSADGAFRGLIGEWREKTGEKKARPTIQCFCREGFLKDISFDVLKALLEGDTYFRQSYLANSMFMFGSGQEKPRWLERLLKSDEAVTAVVAEHGNFAGSTDLDREVYKKMVKNRLNKKRRLKYGQLCNDLAESEDEVKASLLRLATARLVHQDIDGLYYVAG